MQSLSTMDIRAIFAEEITDAGGFVSDTFDDGDRLFARSILPWVAEVRPKDQMKGGVALKSAESEVCIHPYLFRTVCQNGAIRAHAIESRRLEIPDFLSREDATAKLREAVRGCCVEPAFTGAVQEVRSATEAGVNLALNLLPLISRLPAPHGTEILRQIASRFFEDRDRSRFGLMNAVTSVARETRDPELRWRLEELGGGIPVSHTPTPSSDDAADAISLLEWGNRFDRGRCLISDEMLREPLVEMAAARECVSR
jgi:hypothetical protein